MQQHKFVPQLLVALDMLGIENNSVVYRADFLTGWCFVVTHTFSATLGIDFVEFHSHRDRLIGALRLAHVTVDTAFCN